MEDAGVLATDRDIPRGERDEELAVAARSDPAAFGLLYDRHRLAVFRYLRTRTITEDDAAELTAVAFERALTAMPRYRPTGGGFLAWLLRIARNAAIDAGRRASAVPLVVDVPDERRVIAPEASALESEARSTLVAAVNRLPEVQREAIVLRYAPDSPRARSARSSARAIKPHRRSSAEPSQRSGRPTVSTSDTRRSIAKVSDRLDADLLELFSFEPTANVVDRLDDRIERGLRAWNPRAARRSRLRPGRRAGVIGILAATIVIGGASGSLQGLYRLLVGPFDIPWQRGTELNLSQVVDGYRVTIDRAYADATRLDLAISVVDELRREGTTQVEAFSAIVTDASGEYGGVGAASSPDGPFAAANVAWKIPAALPLPDGPRQFHVVIPFIRVRDDTTPPPNADEIGWDPWHRHLGPWTFDFELNVDGGTTVTPNAVAEVDGAQVKVTRMIVASNIVRVEMRVDSDLPADSWGPIGEVRHGDRTLRFVVSSFEADGSIALLTDGGVDNASGDWTVTIDELVGGNTRLAGPWVLQFSVP
jgi:RNA polymerase sigma-70 factor (ECF subfamily)